MVMELLDLPGRAVTHPLLLLEFLVALELVDDRRGGLLPIGTFEKYVFENSETWTWINASLAGIFECSYLMMLKPSEATMVSGNVDIGG